VTAGSTARAASPASRLPVRCKSWFVYVLAEESGAVEVALCWFEQPNMLTELTRAQISENAFMEFLLTPVSSVVT